LLTRQVRVADANSPKCSKTPLNLPTIPAPRKVRPSHLVTEPTSPSLLYPYP
jgi:hypothetical protein